MPTLADLLAAKERELVSVNAVREAAVARQNSILAAVEAAGRTELTAEEDAAFRSASDEKRSADAKTVTITADIENFRNEIKADEEYIARSSEKRDGAPRPKYDERVHVTGEERTYGAHREHGFAREESGRPVFKRGFRPGTDFANDVLAAFRGDYEAQARLQRHMAEERAERGEAALSRGIGGGQQRAVGTGAFAGIVVPQYLTEFYAGMPTNGRPFANVCTPHPLPPTGMQAYLGKVTTGTSVDDQASEGTAASETDIDDTLLTIPIRTATGQQTVSRQAMERGIGVEDTVMGDLFRRYDANIDTKLLNVATNGLTNVATNVAYTDASPTAAELYPKVLQAQSEVVGALLDFASDQQIAVMHSRRWFWMQSQVGTSWPFIGQPGISAQQGGVNYGARYGTGFAGLLPNGTPVIMDNNVATNKGGGTEDEIYVVDPAECHLFEDPNAPMFIRAEQTKAATLQFLLVVYGYYAFEFTRVAHARKVGGTGLIAPTF